MQIDHDQSVRISESGTGGDIRSRAGGDVVTGPPAWIILDVEGTLVPTEYVHRTLYDHARAGLREWVERKAGLPETLQALHGIRQAADLPATASNDQIMNVLLRWMEQDRKEPALKLLQGLIWQQGYASGALRTPLFADVLPALRRWRAAGHRLGIFSSGSVAAQRAVLSCTDGGDLRGLFDHHFDPLSAGPKRDPEAYRSMGSVLAAPHGGPAGSPVFLSDVPAELDAAVAAGWRTIGVARVGEPYGDTDFGPHRVVRHFDEPAGAAQ